MRSGVVAGADSDADAGADAGFLGVQAEGRAECVDEAAGDEGGGFGAGVAFQQDCELIAAEPGDESVVLGGWGCCRDVRGHDVRGRDVRG